MTDPVFGLSQRQPPASLPAEQALLGALLANNKAYERVSDFLRPDHFADAIHGRIYAAIARRIDAGQLADVVTLRTEFENNGIIDDAGGPAYLAQLLSAMVGIINAGEYGRVIRDTWLRRQVIDIGEVAVNLAFGAEAELTADQVMEKVEALLFGLGETAAGQDAALMSAAEVSRQIERANQRAASATDGLVGITSGYRAIDRLKGGFNGGELVLLAGRPGMGKTALGAGIAYGAARAGGRVLFASAEMDAWQVQARIVAMLANLPLQAVLRAWVIDPGTNHGRRLDRDEANRFGEALMKAGKLPIQWSETSAPTVASIRAKARRMKARGGLDLIVVDYLGLLTAADKGPQNNRNEIMTGISSGLKSMAKELRVPVIALSQLSRQVEARDDKRPVLADLRDSGSLEQDADAVMFVYRDEYYLRQGSPKQRDKETAEQFASRVDGWRRRLADSAGVAEVIIAKHRQGATGTARLRWADRLTWFFDDETSAPPHADPGGAPPPPPHEAQQGDPA